ncbi:hypothetical protein Tco_1543352 [Tanacetum coccineum]
MSRFVPKLTELIHPIRNIRKCSDVKEGSNWMSGAEEAPLEQATSIDHSEREGGADDLSTARESLRMIFWRHKVRVVTDGPMEEMLIISGTEGRLEIWAAELRTYDVSCILRKEVEGQVVRKFFKQGEKVLRALDKNG